MEAKKISSQKFLDHEVVEAKRASKDYTVSLGKVINVDGVEYQVVVDGHHSLAAAIADGVEPIYITITSSDSDRELIENVEDYLTVHTMDSDYYDIETGVNVW